MSSYPTIIDPQPTVESLLSTVQSLKIAVEMLSGQRPGDGAAITRYEQPTPPGNVALGDVWSDSKDAGKTYYWNGHFWVDISASRFEELAAQVAQAGLTEEQKKELTDEWWKALLDEHHKISAEIDAAVEQSRVEFNAAVVEANTAIQTVQSDVDAARDEAQAALSEAQQAIYDELNGLTAADNALAAQITTVSATVNNNKALFDNEVVARTNADSALSAQITTVSATASKQRVFSQSSAPSTSGRIVGDLWINTGDSNKIYYWDGTSWAIRDDPRIPQLTASVTAEQIARANADSALAADITTVSAAANKQRVFNQSTAPTATGRLVGDLWYDSSNGFKPYYWNGSDWADNSDNRFTTIAASVTTETAARVAGDNAISAQITSLTSTVNNNTAAISNEATTRANADSALSSSISSLTTTVNNNKAALDNEAVVRANADSALSGQISTLTTSVNNNAAAISNEAIARANADSAISSNVDTVASTVSNHTASIQTLQSSYNGVAVKYGVTGYINGQTGGFVFTGVSRNDGAASYLMEITANVVINGNLLVNGSILTDAAANYAFTEGATGNGNGSASCQLMAKKAGDIFVVIGSYSGGSTSAANSFGFGGTTAGNMAFIVNGNTNFANVAIRGFMYQSSIFCAYGSCAITNYFATAPTTYTTAVTAAGAGLHTFQVTTGLGELTTISVFRLSK